MNHGFTQNEKRSSDQFLFNLRGPAEVNFILNFLIYATFTTNQENLYRF